MIKLPNTLQEIFDVVSKHLLTQIKRSMACVHQNRLESCAYRGKNGTKCAAGILIPDDEYEPGMESNAWSTLVENGKAENKFSREINLLQLIHDENRNDDIEFLKRELIGFAEKRNLTHNIEV